MEHRCKPEHTEAAAFVNDLILYALALYIASLVYVNLRVRSSIEPTPEETQTIWVEAARDCR